MNRVYLTCGALFAALTLSAQDLSLCHQVVGTTGKAVTESGLNFQYTVGEPIIATFKKQGVNIVLTQGFNQPDVCLPVTSTQPELWSGWDIQVYPNPASDWLTVQFTSPSSQTLQCNIFGPDGKVVVSDVTASPTGVQIDVSALSSGLYYLQLNDPVSGASGSVRFVKSR